LMVGFLHNQGSMQSLGNPSPHAPKTLSPQASLDRLPVWWDFEVPPTMAQSKEFTHGSDRYFPLWSEGALSFNSFSRRDSLLLLFSPLAFPGPLGGHPRVPLTQRVFRFPSSRDPKLFRPFWFFKVFRFCPEAKQQSGCAQTFWPPRHVSDWACFYLFFCLPLLPSFFLITLWWGFCCPFTLHSSWAHLGSFFFGSYSAGGFNPFSFFPPLFNAYRLFTSQSSALRVPSALHRGFFFMHTFFFPP